jgi:hypothetical protein
MDVPKTLWKPKVHYRVTKRHHGTCPDPDELRQKSDTVYLGNHFNIVGIQVLTAAGMKTQSSGM